MNVWEFLLVAVVTASVVYVDARPKKTNFKQAMGEPIVQHHVAGENQQKKPAVPDIGGGIEGALNEVKKFWGGGGGVNGEGFGGGYGNYGGGYVNYGGGYGNYGGGYGGSFGNYGNYGGGYNNYGAYGSGFGYGGVFG